MNKYSSKSAQGGFTLIELIVVIVILGILAATALPKFASLGGDARAASLKAAQGSINSSAAIFHAKWMIDNPASINIDGTVVTMANGYPTASTAFATAAGLKAEDYTVTDNGTSLTIRPAKLASGANSTCVLTYNESVPTAPDAAGVTRNAPPVVTLVVSDCE